MMLRLVGMSHLVSILDAQSVGKVGIGLGEVAKSDFRFGTSLAATQGGFDLTYLLISPARTNMNGDICFAVHQLAQTPSPYNVVFSFFRGTEYYVSSIFSPAVPFDFVLPWKSHLPISPDRPILPFGFVDTATRATVGTSYRDFYNQLRGLMPGLNFVHILPPPPLRVFGDMIYQQYPDTQEVRDFINGGGVSPEFYRLKYYYLFERLIVEQLDSVGVKCLSAPDVVCDHDGFLKPDYARDCMHGNQYYGDIVLKQISDFLMRGG